MDDAVTFGSGSGYDVRLVIPMIRGNKSLVLMLVDWFFACLFSAKMIGTRRLVRIT